MLRLAAKHDKLLRVPAIDMLKDSAPREGFFEDHQYEAGRRLRPADLQVAVAIMHTYGWRRREVLALERRQLDLEAGTLRLEPGTTRNSEGKITGHKTESVHRRYAIVSDADLQEAARKLAGIIPSISTGQDVDARSVTVQTR